MPNAVKRFSIRNREASVSSVLLKVALATAGGAAIFAPAAHAQASCVQTSATAFTCSGTTANGLQLGPDVDTFSGRGLVINRPSTPPDTARSGVELRRDTGRQGIFIGVALDPTSRITANGGQNTPAWGVYVRDIQHQGFAPFVIVDSAAAITLNTNFDAPALADFLGQPWQITDRVNRISFIDTVRPGFSLITPGADLIWSHYALSNPQLVGRLFNLGLVNCYLPENANLLPLPINGMFCLPGMNMPTDRSVFEGKVNDLVFQLNDEVVYYRRTPLPNDINARDYIRAAIYAQSLGWDGAPSGQVTITNTGRLQTTGDFGFGIFGQAWTTAGEFTTVGGVHVLNRGEISTTGDSSVGIFAQSRGQVSDWPGHAALVQVDGNGRIATQGAVAYGIYAGGIGGDSTHGGGDAPSANGGPININYGGVITTEGFAADGVFAESRGGRGGNGRSAADFHGSDAGGIGGFGGQIDITIARSGGIGGIETQGDEAHGVFAISIAGDGGNGGAGYLDSWYPSRGGAGGNGGVVSITNNAAILTHGDDAFGVSASSFAGAGGFGGDDSAVLFRRGRGGNGGPAGQGGNVTLINARDALVQTFGDGSIGMFAQSIGGLAGNGGRSRTAFNSRGGEGGTRETTRCQDDNICPDGGIVTITNNGVVRTAGDFAQAVFGQSVGGGGGLGGRASGWVAVSGGDGGDAGYGKDVIIDNFGDLITGGDFSAAVFAQSIGGGGGTGGDANGGGFLAAVTIGGDGGAGGDGGLVTVRNQSTGRIFTSGARSDGVFAQSVGGGGGAGGDATSFAVGGGLAASISIGGSGEGGGMGGTVLVENRGLIDASGDFSNGIFAQSIGGGGGVGGSAYSFSGSLGIVGSLAVSVAVGGSGAGGGKGGLVTVNNFGTINTWDFNAFGILAQSVGGGGGAGGSSTARAISANVKKGAAVAASIAIGGSGGTGGNGDLVTVDNRGSIFTYGDQSGGIFAQSVGGGGGVGGDASAASETISGGKSSDVKIDVNVGGSGAAGGNGGRVDVDNSAGGTIVTLGALSNGITAQSVGGGGGYGGAGVQGDLFEDFDIPDPPEFEDGDESQADRQRARQRYGSLQGQARQRPSSADSIGRSSKKGGKGGGGAAIGVSISLGGSGGPGGDGDLVDVDNFGEIITGGFFSAGVFAQSVGGGGGAGGGATASGSGDVGIGAGLGGDGSTGGNGGLVTVTNVGDITTLGALSFGIIAQSVGGGGGAGAVGEGSGEEDHNLKLSIGGDGGNGGTGGEVTVDQRGNILTLGFASFGIFAQSVGGGGGFGGAAEQDGFASIAIGGDGALGGGARRPADDFASKVTVIVSGRITTEGDFAHGVVAQSVGGGGGMAGGINTSTFTLGDPYGLLEVDTGLTTGVGTIGLAGDGGGGGNGGVVSVTTSGTITTFGRGAHGVFAQSVGGGGGSGGAGGAQFPVAVALSGSNGDAGTAGAVGVTHTGNIHVYGDDAVGIWAQSVGGAGSNNRGGDITINLISGEIIGGSGASGAGVFMASGKTNTLTNTGGRISAASGNAIIATDGDDRIVNSGLIDGNVGLGRGANAFTNQANGRFNTRSAVYLGAGNLLTNSGVLSPYGDGAVGTTTLVGNLTQGATGDLRVNLNFGSPSDLLVVQGTASLGGKVTPVFERVRAIRAGTFVTVVRATSLTNAGITMDGADTLAIDFSTRFQGNEFQIGVASVNFVIDGLNTEQGAVASHLQQIWNSPASTGLDAMLETLAMAKDAGVFEAIVDGLNPYAAFTQGSQAVGGGQFFLSGMMSCPAPDSAAKVLHETACLWARVSHTDTDQAAAGPDPGYHDGTDRMQMGQQFSLGAGWFAGYGLGYESSRFEMGDTSRASTDTTHLMGSLKYETGPLLFAAAADIAHSATDRQRRTGFPTLVTATSETDTMQAALRLRAAYTAEAGGFYLRPSIDLDGYYIDTDAFEETGAGAFNMVVAGGEQRLGAATASLEAGLVARAGQFVVHPYVELSTTRMSEDHLEISAHLQGAAAGVTDFIAPTPIPEELTGARLGFEMLMQGGSMRIEYEQRTSDRYESRTASVKLRAVF
jgi:hypothetical protein